MYCSYQISVEKQNAEDFFLALISLSLTLSALFPNLEYDCVNPFNLSLSIWITFDQKYFQNSTVQ